MQRDGANIAEWLVRLSTFTGQLCKRFKGMELTGICQFVLNQLYKSNGVPQFMHLLGQIIQDMANVPIVVPALPFNNVGFPTQMVLHTLV